MRPPQSDDPSFQTSVNLVQVDAAVTDSKGKRVTNLERGDFDITEDGRPQRITNFSRIDAASPRTAIKAPGPRSRNLRKEDVHRSIVLLVDDRSMAPNLLNPVVTAAKKFVTEQIATGDLVAISATGFGMGVLQRFTGDKRQMNAALDFIPGAYTTQYIRHIAIPDSMPSAWTGPIGVNCGSGSGVMGYLNWAIQGLRELPGRKALVIFSCGFYVPSDAMQPIVDLANRSGVVVYVIDPEGGSYSVVPSNESLRLLAAQTGGLWIKSAPGSPLVEDLSGVLDDMGGYYLIGYQRGDAENGRAVHHNIRVTVKRKGLTVRARNGFIGRQDAALPRPAPHTVDGFLQEALFSPFNAGAVRLRVDPMYAATLPDTKTGRRNPVIRAALSVRGDDLHFGDAESGKKKLILDSLVAVFSQEGTPIASREQVLTFTVTPQRAAELAVSGLHIAMDVRLAGPGPYQIRAAVRDEGSGAVGSDYSFLDVPDFNKAEIALSSIELSTQQGEQRDAGNEGWEEYVAGTDVRFECEIFGVKTTPAQPQESRVEMQVRLFHEGESTPVFDSDVLAVPASSLAENYLAGHLKIGSNLEPGEYTMQLTAYDRLAGAKKQIATQWADLTIVNPAPAMHQ